MGNVFIWKRRLLSEPLKNDEVKLLKRENFYKNIRIAERVLHISRHPVINRKMQIQNKKTYMKEPQVCCFTIFLALQSMFKKPININIQLIASSARPWNVSCTSMLEHFESLIESSDHILNKTITFLMGYEKRNRHYHQCITTGLCCKQTPTDGLSLGSPCCLRGPTCPSDMLGWM